MSILRSILPILVVLVVGYFGFNLLSRTPEVAAPERPPPAPPVVETLSLTPKDHTIILRTRGAARPRTITPLSPEVAGRVTEVMPALRPGRFFKEGDPLLKIDPLDYETALAVTTAEVAGAQATLEDESARAAQAIDDWKRLGRTGVPPPLLARTPQLAGARATLESAEARLRQARRDMERTTLRAPYDGRVLEQNADVGQAIGTTGVVATIFSTETVEVRLPLTGEEFAFVDVSSHPSVALTGPGGTFAGSWEGTITRTEGSLDERTRQIFVVAEVREPFASDPPLEIGLFLEAAVTGRTLEDVYVIPASSVRASGEVILVSAENTLIRKDVVPIFSNAEFAVIAAKDLPENPTLCLTPLAFPVPGTKVSPSLDSPGAVNQGPSSAAAR